MDNPPPVPWPTHLFLYLVNPSDSPLVFKEDGDCQTALVNLSEPISFLPGGLP